MLARLYPPQYKERGLRSTNGKYIFGFICIMLIMLCMLSQKAFAARNIELAYLYTTNMSLVSTDDPVNYSYDGSSIVIKNESKQVVYNGFRYSVSPSRFVFLFGNDTSAPGLWQNVRAVNITVQDDRTTAYSSSTYSEKQRWTNVHSDYQWACTDSKTGIRIDYDYSARAYRISNLPSDCHGIAVYGVPLSGSSGSLYYAQSYKTITLGFTVSYNYNGGSGSPPYVQNTTYVTLPSPSRSGYDFAGWYDGGTWVGGSGGGYNVSRNVTLTAHWNLKTYWQNININDPNGTEGMGNVGTFYYHTDSTGWTGPVSDQGNDTTLSSGSHIYINRINITGKGMEFAGITSTKGSVVDNGWGHYTYTVPAESGTVNINTKWKTYTLSFDSNGGSAVVWDETKSNTCPVVYTYNWYSIRGSNATTRAGYTFTGWYSAKDGGEQVYDASGTAVPCTYWSSSKTWQYDGNATVYAHWQINSYYLDLNGSGPAISDHGGLSPAGLADVYINGSKVQSDGGDYCKTHPYGTKYEMDLKEVPGYTLNSISVTSEGVNGSHSISGATVTGTIGAGQTTIVGNYSPNSYTVEYYTNDGTGTNGEGTKIASETWSYAAEKTLQGQGTMKRVYTVSYSINVESTSHSKPAQPVQQTYTYVPLGWSTNQKALKADYAFGAAVKNLTTAKNGVVKMYAVWGPQNTEFKLPTPVRHGYTFEGWYDGNTKVGNGGDTTYKPAKDTTLTAHWSKPITYHAYYSLYGGSAKVRKDFTVEDTFTLNAPTVNQNYTFLGWIGDTDPQDHGAWGSGGAAITEPQKSPTVPAGTYGDVFFRAVYQPKADALIQYKNAYYTASELKEIPIK
jgi:uncharacterized repeat protein (TIGR02543 family)